MENQPGKAFPPILKDGWQGANLLRGLHASVNPRFEEGIPARFGEHDGKILLTTNLEYWNSDWD